MDNLALIIVFVVSSLIIWSLIYQARRREVHYAELRQANDALTQLFHKQDKDIQRLSQECVSLCKSQYEGIKDILERTITSRNNEKTEEIYKARLIEQISLFSNAERQQEREALIDSKTGGILSSLRRNFPSIKDLDIQIVTYSLMGFDTTLICLLTGMNPGNVYTRKSRLKDKILKSDIGDKDRYLYWLF